MNRKSDPTPAIRALTYARDFFCCVSCGNRKPLQFQHRQRVGMGGSTKRPSMVQGLTSCHRCNDAYEGHMQRDALRFGWKVRSWVEHAGRVPVYYMPEGAWFRLTLDGVRVRISQMEAVEMMREVYGDDQWEQMNLGVVR